MSEVPTSVELHKRAEECRAAYASLDDRALLTKSIEVLKADAPRLAYEQYKDPTRNCHCIVGAAFEAAGVYYEAKPGWLNELPGIGDVTNGVKNRLAEHLLPQFDQALVDAAIQRETTRQDEDEPEFFQDELSDSVAKMLKHPDQLDDNDLNASPVDLIYFYSDLVLFPLGPAGKDEAIKLYQRALDALPAKETTS